jgi:diadenosine tetraphosphatase ApaH/serine/threonine PP2A family protein phosphatase
VVAVGDLTVKGPKSRPVLDLFSTDDRFSSVIGNHDLALVKKWQRQNITLKPSQELAYEELEKGGVHYFQYLSSLPFAIDLETHIVVHAGLRPGVPLEEQSEEDLTELRTLGADRTCREGLPWYEVYEGPKVALFGHWPAIEPRGGPFAIGLDTGCVYGNKLTAHVIETGKFFSVGAAKVYDSRENNTVDASCVS